MRNYWFFNWRKLNPLHPRMLCAKICWKFLSGSEEEDFLISSVYFHYFVIISPWKMVGSFIWRNLNPLHPRMLCAKIVRNWPSCSGEEDFKISSMYFCYFLIISPWKKTWSFIFIIISTWKRTGPFIWTNLSPLNPRMICAKFGWNWFSGSLEDEMWKV